MQEQQALKIVKLIIERCRLGILHGRHLHTRSYVYSVYSLTVTRQPMAQRSSSRVEPALLHRQTGSPQGRQGQNSCGSVHTF